MAEQDEPAEVERQRDTPFDPDESRRQHEREPGPRHGKTTSETDGDDRDREAIEDYGSREDD